MKENVFLIAKHLHIVGLEFFNSGICQRVMCHLLQDFIRHGGDIRTGQCAVGHMNRVAHAKSTTVDMNTAALQYFSQITRDLSPEQFHRLLNIIKEIVAESRVPIKQYLQKFPKWGRFGVTSVTPFLLLPVHPEGCTPARRT